MPCRHIRSSTGFGPGDRSGQGGSSGSINAHKSSSTIHGRVVTLTRTIRSSDEPRAGIDNVTIAVPTDDEVTPPAPG
ncbi:hypothetical protein [Streptomyces sp. NBC_00344]|uniref:hypothetical protein n=1 Tax=Streptomyces sp. NBC_00344 TaxID=2975720 RepID=UPI002E1D006C